MSNTKKKLEEDKLEGALDLALMIFGKMEIDNARGDEKMLSDGMKHITEGAERINKHFRKETSH